MTSLDQEHIESSSESGIRFTDRIKRREITPRASSSSFAERVKQSRQAPRVAKGRYAERVAHSRASLIYLVRGTDITGRKAWYYVQIEPLKKHLFEVRAKLGQINIVDYGQIIKSGYGEDPPESVRQIMYEEHGFEHD